MNCILCGEHWPQKNVPFSAVCEKCHCWLHSCIQCGLWDAEAQMCRSMTTDAVADRQGKNFCEEWKPATTGAKDSNPGEYRDKFDSLFGN